MEDNQVIDLFGDNGHGLTPTQCIMPQVLARLLNAASMDKFDPMIGYGYAMALTSALAQRYCRLNLSSATETELGLYFLTIAQSGSGKGSIWKPLYAPIKDLVSSRRNLDKEDNEIIRAQNIAIDSLITEKRKQARKHSGASLQIYLREITELEMQKRPLNPEYVFDVQDVTTAGLLQLLASQEDHSVLIADTEGRFMRSIDEDKSLSAMLNQTFCGEAICNSRASVKSIRVDTPHVSIVTAVQPEKLNRLTNNPNLWGEGFMARVLPYYSLPQSANIPAIGEIRDSEIMNWWGKKLTDLFHMQVHRDTQGRVQPYPLELDANARVCLENHTHELQNMKLWPVNIGIHSHLARMPEVISRLAAIYHILEHQYPFEVRISAQTMQLAVNAGRFFTGQTQRLYAEFNPDPIVKLLPRICGFLKSLCGTKNYVTARDIYTNIGGVKTGLTQAIKLLWDQGVLCQAAECVPIPNFTGWTTIKSYGFIINFPLLQPYPD